MEQKREIHQFLKGNCRLLSVIWVKWKQSICSVTLPCSSTFYSLFILFFVLEIFKFKYRNFFVRHSASISKFKWFEQQWINLLFGLHQLCHKKMEQAGGQKQKVWVFWKKHTYASRLPNMLVATRVLLNRCNRLPTIIKIKMKRFVFIVLFLYTYTGIYLYYLYSLCVLFLYLYLFTYI